jgi:hypothetical protein
MKHTMSRGVRSHLHEAIIGLLEVHAVICVETAYGREV